MSMSRRELADHQRNVVRWRRDDEQRRQHTIWAWQAEEVTCPLCGEPPGLPCVLVYSGTTRRLWPGVKFATKRHAVRQAAMEDTILEPFVFRDPAAVTA